MSLSGAAGRAVLVLVLFPLLLLLLSAPGCSGDPSSPAGTESTGSTVSGEPTVSTILSPEERVLAGMSVREKAAQVLLVGFPGTSPPAEHLAFWEEAPPGGIILFGRNVEGAEQVEGLTRDLQAVARAGGGGDGGDDGKDEEDGDVDGGIPFLVAVDQEGGEIRRIREGVPDLPGARILGEGSSPQEAARWAEETGVALRELGISMNMAPVADVVESGDHFLFNRSYSGDPEEVASFVEAVVSGYEKAGVVAVVKRFPGHGAAAGDTHRGLPVVTLSREELEKGHLLPFRRAVDVGVPAVMAAHLLVEAWDPEHRVTASRAVLEGLLRGQLGFEGVIVTDDLEMGAVIGDGEDPGEAAAAVAAASVESLKAGADLLLVGHTLARQRAARQALVEAVRDGGVSEERLDAAVLRVLRLKREHGIW